MSVTTDNKIAVKCPILICQHNLQIPSNKHIETTCPKCGSKLEFEKGSLLSYTVNKEGFRRPHAINKDEFRRLPEPKKQSWLPPEVKVLMAAASIVLLVLVGNVIVKAIDKNSNEDYAEYAAADTAFIIPEAVPPYQPTTDTATTAPAPQQASQSTNMETTMEEVLPAPGPISVQQPVATIIDTAGKDDNDIFDILEKIKDILDTGKDILEALAELSDEELEDFNRFTYEYEYYKNYNRYSSTPPPFTYTPPRNESRASKTEHIIKAFKPCTCRSIGLP